MPHFIINRMHWACVDCLVRAMCSQRCDRTYYKHYLCENCPGCLTYPCNKIKKLQIYERVWLAYGDKFIQAWKDQPSLFDLIKQPKKPFTKWWYRKE